MPYPLPWATQRVRLSADPTPKEKSLPSLTFRKSGTGDQRRVCMGIGLRDDPRGVERRCHMLPLTLLRLGRSSGVAA